MSWGGFGMTNVIVPGGEMTGLIITSGRMSHYTTMRLGGVKCTSC